MELAERLEGKFQQPDHALGILEGKVG